MVDPLNDAIARTGVASVKNSMQLNRLEKRSTKQRLRYPLEDQDDYKGRISFIAKQEEGVTIQSQLVDKLLNPTIDNPVTGPDQAKADVEKTKIKKQQQDNIRSAIKGVNLPQQQKLPSYIGSGRKCVLYLPNTIQFQDAVSYSNIDLGLLGGVAEAALNSGATGREALGALANAATSIFTADGLVEAFNSGLQSQGAQVAALRLARRLNTEVAGAITTTTGIALNPNKRAALQGPNLRTFRFSFKMIPTTHEEAEEIKAIVQFFREEMHPENVRELGINSALRYPSKFFIKMTYNGKKVAHNILPSFLTDVNVVYNASGMSFHKDGNFQETDLSLAFTEERTLNKRDVALGGY
tara:strand:- start:133 stop:1194 length:1062 start_codon:yes stop_codon:yes gene_type:complete